MKLNSLALANAGGLLAAFIYAVCRLAVGLFPDLTLSIARSWFHGVSLEPSGLRSGDLGSTVFGLISLSIFTWAAAYLFSLLYNYFLKS